MITITLAVLCLIWVVWSLVAMERKRLQASAMGIPLIRLCIDPQNMLWMIISPHLWPLLDKLPIDWGTFRKYSRRGWFFEDGGESHRRYGPIFALVTPRQVYIYVANAEATNNIYQRRAEFIRPVEQYMYGRCISTADTMDWPRHRKVLAAPFNENAMSFVWDESVKQATEMLQVWTAPGTKQIPSVAKDTRTVALNVLAATGFRKSYPFQSADADKQESGVTSYRDALQTVLDNVILLLVVPRRLLALSFVPAAWNRVAKAADEFQNYMTRMLDEEIKAMNEGKAGTGGLMTFFVRAMDTKQKQDAKIETNGLPMGLNIDEVFGNIFVINFAGHDTTANTLSFAMLLLAVHPEVQDWVAEELRQMGEIRAHYADIFPRLNRCQAIMHETLRLFPPILALPRRTNGQPQTLYIKENPVVIPPGFSICSTLLALHTSPKYWENPTTWSPSRWVSAAPDSSSSMSEKLISSAHGSYIPWSDGPQSCPEKKFSQVEFVAVLATILREHRVSAIPNHDETAEETRARVIDTTRDVDMLLLLRMKDADRVRLVCRRAE